MIPVSDYSSIKDFILRMDMFIDIMNGKKGHGIITSADHPDMLTLLDTLNWFAEWNASVPHELEFITRECYDDFQVRWINADSSDRGQMNCRVFRSVHSQGWGLPRWDQMGNG